MLYGRNPAVPPLLYSLLPKNDSISPSKYIYSLVQTLIKIHTQAFVESFNKRARAQSRDSAKRHDIQKFAVDDQVLYHNPLDNPRKNKLSTIWDGPFTIIEPNGQDSYTIKHLETGAVVNRLYTKFLKKISS